jgi:hypothetical protein
MNRRQFPRSPAEYGPGAARTRWLLHRMRDATAFARRSAHRKGDAAMDTARAIESQLHTLQPISSAQRASTRHYMRCAGGGGRRDTRHRRMRPDGAKPRRRPRRDALPGLPGYFATGDGDLRGRPTRSGIPMRHPPGVRHLRASHSNLRRVFTVRQIGPQGLAS